MNLSLLKELTLLRESAEATSEKGSSVQDAKPHLNKISSMLFGKKCEPVVDDKRSKKPIFFGVANSKSKVHDARGKPMRLTFDNSTDSGEFEINSLTPLHIVDGGDLDKKIRALYKKHKVSSKKKTNYLDVGGEMVMREIHLGVSPTEHAVRLVRDFLKLIKGESVADEEPIAPVEDEEKPEKKEEPKKKEVKKEVPKKKETDDSDK